MNKRYLIGGAALAALVAMVYMMRSSASAAVASTGGLSSGSGSAGQAWSTMPIVVSVPAKPTSVPDQVAASPAPAPHPVFGAPGPTIAAVPLNDGSNPNDPGRNTAEQDSATQAFLSHPFF